MFLDQLRDPNELSALISWQRFQLGIKDFIMSFYAPNRMSNMIYFLLSHPFLGNAVPRCSSAGLFVSVVEGASSATFGAGLNSAKAYVRE